MKAEDIKKTIIARKIEKAKPVSEAEILGVKGWLFRVSSALMEDWRQYRNAIKPDGKPDLDKTRLAPAKLVQISFRDEQGDRVFDDADVAVIAGIDEKEIGPICRKIMTINGYSDESLESLLKNLIAITGVGGLYDLLASINAPCPNCSKDSTPSSSESNGSASGTGLQEPQPNPGGQD